MDRPKPEIFKFERLDWTLFRSLSTLPQKAGVPPNRLRRLVLKELTDNALDAGGEVEIGELPDGGYFIQDNGPGIAPEDIAMLFSIDRPLVSSKRLRLPTRGSLGNGLRVVTGAVLASRGRLVVWTRDRRIQVIPQDDGTSVTEIESVVFPTGTKVEIEFGLALPDDRNALSWAELAARVGHHGELYKGKSSPHWYDDDAFFELLQAAGDRPVRDLVAELDGCSGAKAGKIAAAFRGKTCAGLSRSDASELLRAARRRAREVNPNRLGAIGAHAHLEPHHVKITGTFETGTGNPARIPFVVEAWADAGEKEDTVVDYMVNRTPVTGTVATIHEKSKLYIQGCGLRSQIDVGKRPLYVTLNITTPYCPITTDGKEPDFSVFRAEIEQAIKKAAGKACRASPVSRNNENSLLPRKPRGRRSAAETATHQAQLMEFCEKIIEIRSTLDFDVSSRGWCYILEEHGLPKGDFSKAQEMITECRKSGLLPLEIVAEDVAREFKNLESLDDDRPEDQAWAIVDRLWKAHLDYSPISFWDDQPYYVEMLAEKVDLRSLFDPICEKFHIPIANARGWSDLNSRAAMMRRFAGWEAKGKKCVLLYCGDHDPGGLQISDRLQKNLTDLAGAVGWNPDNLIIDRFGLNYDFIDHHDLTWIENLETSSGKQLNDPRHPDHKKAYVQDYLTEFGARKVEANALVVRSEAGRELCRQAILKYIDDDAPGAYEAKLGPRRDEVRRHVRDSLRQHFTDGDAT